MAGSSGGCGRGTRQPSLSWLVPVLRTSSRTLPRHNHSASSTPQHTPQHTASLLPLLPRSLVVVGSQFSQNSASGYGAGIAVGDGASLNASQSLFAANGASSCASSRPVVRRLLDGETPCWECRQLGGPSCRAASRRRCFWSAAKQAAARAHLPRCSRPATGNAGRWRHLRRRGALQRQQHRPVRRQRGGRRLRLCQPGHSQLQRQPGIRPGRRGARGGGQPAHECEQAWLWDSGCAALC